MPSSKRPIGPGGTLRVDDADDFRARVARNVKTEVTPLVVVIAGPDVGKSIRLDRTLTVGRGQAADEVLTDDRVSLTHLRFEDRGDAWAVVDLESTNGTRIDDQPVTEAILAHHTKIHLGTTILRFELQDETDQAYGELVERLISLDDLTGLYQRRRFDQELAALFTAGKARMQRTTLRRCATFSPENQAHSAMPR